MNEKPLSQQEIQISPDLNQPKSWPNVHERPTNEFTWATIQIDYKISAAISSGISQKFVQGDLSEPKWDQASYFAAALARIIEKSFELKADTIKLRQRLVQTELKVMNPEICLIVVGDESSNSEKLQHVIETFTKFVCSQATLALDQSEKSNLEETVYLEVENRAMEFLTLRNGERIKRQLHVHAIGVSISSLTGAWRPVSSQVKISIETKSVKAFFNGRRLDDRVLFLRELGGQARKLEIFYDEQRFDESLRGLKEDKFALLNVEYQEKESNNKNKKSTLILKSFIRELTQDFQLE